MYISPRITRRVLTIYSFITHTNFLWDRLLVEADMAWVMPFNCASLLVMCFDSFGNGKKTFILWSCAILAIFWVVWIERSRKIF